MSVPISFGEWQEVMDPRYGGWSDNSGMMFYDGWFFPYGDGVWIELVQYIGNGYWLIRWTSNNLPPVTYYVWINGALVATTPLTQTIIYVGTDEELEIFVFDDADDLPPPYYTKKIDIYWERAEETSHYLVQQWVDTQWVTLRQQPEIDLASYEFTTDPLPDLSQQQFRVVAVGRSENQTVIKIMSVLVVGRPDRPSVSWSYDDPTRQVTVMVN